MAEDATESLQPSDAEQTRTIAAASSSGAAAPAKVGDTLDGRYLLIEALGHGGFGWVYRAKDLQLDREVALKLLRGDRNAAGSFGEKLVQEGRALARLEHPGIVPVYDAGTSEGTPYLVMAFVSGKPLSDLLEDRGPLPIKDCIDIVEQVCEALDYAHQRGIVHGDIKPANLLLEDGGRVRVVDFGIARIRRDARTEATGGVSGTLGYIAPEVLQGLPAGPRCDQFAVGAMLFEMLTGKRPFPGTTLDEIVRKVVHEPTPSVDALRRNLPRGIGQAVTKSLAKNPDQRFADGRSLVSALRRALRLRLLGHVAAAAAAVAVLAGAAWGAYLWTRPLTIDARLMAEQAVPGGDFVQLPVIEGTRLRSGDRFWVADVTPSRDAWVYVLLLDSSGRLEQLFPAEGIPLELPLDGGESYEIPPGMRWALDFETGMETVFVIASTRELLPGQVDDLLARANADSELIASNLGERSRGVEGLVASSSRRVEQENSVAKLLAEQFPAVRRFAVKHD